MDIMVPSGVYTAMATFSIFAVAIIAQTPLGEMEKFNDTK